MTQSFNKKCEYYSFFFLVFYQSYIYLCINIYLFLSKTDYDNNNVNVMIKLSMFNDVDLLSEHFYSGDLHNRDYR